MRFYVILFSSLLFVFLSCSVVRSKDSNPCMSEDIDGVIIVFQRACFFVPNEYSDYLAWDNSSEMEAKALVIDGFAGNDEISSYNPIVVPMDMLPNKDSSDVIVLLERSHFDIINENSFYIVPAKVNLTTYYKPIQNLSFSYILRFRWNEVVYKYNCIYDGSPIYCKIISLNERQRNWILNAQLLPTGKDYGLKDSINKVPTTFHRN